MDYYCYGCRKEMSDVEEIQHQIYYPECYKPNQVKKCPLLTTDPRWMVEL
jgi:hypothetical protein